MKADTVVLAGIVIILIALLLLTGCQYTGRNIYPDDTLPPLTTKVET